MPPFDRSSAAAFRSVAESYVARLPEAERAGVLARVRELGARQPQPIRFRYRCEARLAPRR